MFTRIIILILYPATSHKHRPRRASEWTTAALVILKLRAKLIQVQALIQVIKYLRIRIMWWWYPWTLHWIIAIKCNMEFKVYTFQSESKQEKTTTRHQVPIMIISTKFKYRYHRLGIYQHQLKYLMKMEHLSRHKLLVYCIKILERLLMKTKTKCW